ncbi:hypothetical protein V8F06_012485 [Rhypophila decipiens]
MTNTILNDTESVEWRQQQARWDTIIIWTVIMIVAVGVINMSFWVVWGYGGLWAWARRTVRNGVARAADVERDIPLRELPRAHLRRSRRGSVTSEWPFAL